MRVDEEADQQTVQTGRSLTESSCRRTSLNSRSYLKIELQMSNLTGFSADSGRYVASAVPQSVAAYTPPLYSWNEGWSASMATAMGCMDTALV
jgi:hypothetical protein